jgi:hypothetical protein
MIYVSYRAIFDLKASGTKLSKGGGNMTHATR